MTLITTAIFATPEMANFAVAILFQITSELGTIETTFLFKARESHLDEMTMYVMGYMIVNVITKVTGWLSTKYHVFSHFELTKIKPSFDLSFLHLFSGLCL